MADLVRAVTPDGTRVHTYGRRYALAHDLELVDEPAAIGGRRAPTTSRASDRPAKPRKSVDALAAEKAPKNSDTGPVSVEAASSADDNTNPSTKES